jgi:hypothetical protein
MDGAPHSASVNQFIQGIFDELQHIQPKTKLIEGFAIEVRLSKVHTSSSRQSVLLAFSFPHQPFLLQLITQLFTNYCTSHAEQKAALMKELNVDHFMVPIIALNLPIDMVSNARSALERLTSKTLVIEMLVMALR